MTNYCAHCGRILPENAAFCPACGTPVIEAASNHQEPKEPETLFERFKADYWGTKGRLCRKAYLLRSLLFCFIIPFRSPLYGLGSLFCPRRCRKRAGLFYCPFHDGKQPRDDGSFHHAPDDPSHACHSPCP